MANKDLSAKIREKYSTEKRPAGTTANDQSSKSTTANDQSAKIRKKYSTDLSTVSVNDFLNRANSYFDSASKSLKSTGYSTASKNAEDRRKQAQELRMEALGVDRYLDVNRSSMDENTYKTLKQYVSEIGYETAKVTDAFDTAEDYYSQFSDREKFNDYRENIRQNAWLDKYQNKNYTDLNILASKMEDGDEKNWVTRYAESVYTPEEGKAVLDKLTKEAEADQKEYWNLYELRTQAAYGGANLTNPDASYKGIEARMQQILDKYGAKNVDDIKAYVSREQQHNTLLEREQEKQKMLSVGDKESANYDPEFSYWSKTRTKVPTAQELENYDIMTNASTWQVGDDGKLRDAFGTEIDTTKRDANGKVLHPSAGSVNAEDRLGIYLASKSDSPEYSVTENTWGTLDKIIAEGDSRHWDRLTSDQIDTYYYYLNKEGAESANRYLDLIQDTVNKDLGTEMYTEMQDDSKALKALFGLSVGTDQWGAGLGGFGRQLRGENDYVAPSAKQYAGQMVREDLSGGWGFAYDSATTIGNMAPSVLTSIVANAILPGSGIVGSLTIGASASGNAYDQMINEGYSVDQARTYGALVGASEVALESLLGGISEFGGGALTKGITKAMSAADNSLLKLAVNAGNTKAGRIITSMISEGEEEGLQEILSTWLKNMITHSDEDINWEEVGYSTLLGALTGGVFEAPSVALDSIIDNAELRGVGKTIVETEGGVDALKALAIDLSGSQSKLGKLAEKTISEPVKGEGFTGKAKAFFKNVSNNRRVGKLYEAVKTEVTKQNRSDIATALGEKGFSATSAKNIAEAIAARINGEELDKFQQMVLDEVKNNKTVNDVVTNVINDDASNVVKRTSDLNAYRYGVATGKAIAPTETAKPQFDVSDEGKTILHNADGSARYVEVKRVSKIENGKVSLELSDGSVVDANDVSFASNGEAWTYSVLAEIGADAEQANTLLAAYNGNTELDRVAYARGVQEAYRYGSIGIPLSKISESGFAARMSESARTYAYNMGAMQGIKNASIKQQNLAQKKIKPQRYHESFVQERNGVKYDDVDINAEKLNARQKTGIQLAEFLASLGMDVHVFKSKQVNGVFVGENGTYRLSDGSIHVDLNAGAKGEGLVAYTLSHETTHFIKDWSPEKYKTFADALFEEVGKTDASIDGMVANTLERIRGMKEYKGKTEDELWDIAYDEVVAEMCETMLTDTDAAVKIVDRIKKTDSELLNKIIEFFDNLLTKLKNVLKANVAYKDSSPDSIIAQQARDTLKNVERLRDLFADALVDATGTFRNAKQSTVEYAESTMSNEEAFEDSSVAVLNQIRPPYSDGSKAFNGFVENLDPEARKTFDLFYGFYQKSRITNTMSVTGKRVKAVNISSLYLLAQDWNDMLAKEPKWASAAKELADFLPDDVRKRMNMNEDGTLNPTMLEKEFKMPSSMAQRLVDALPVEAIEATYRMGNKEITLPEGKARQSVGGEAYRRAIIDETRKLFAEGKLKQVSIGTMSKDRWGSLGFLAANGKTGASGDFTTVCPQMMFNRGCWYCYRRAAMEKGVNNKLVAQSVWYTGEILRIKDSDITALNRNGGLRIQSFGDWMPHFSAMLADVLYDAEQRGLQVKIITKEPSMINYIAALRDQGIGKNLYFNLSADYTIERGPAKQATTADSLDAVNPERPFMRYDNSYWWKRAMTVEEAAKYREKYPWVNTRIVATTQEEFIRGLKDPKVDVVTGYHGNIREFERVDSATGEHKVQVEALGDAGMPRFAFNPMTNSWTVEYEGKTSTHKKLAAAIAENNLQMEYYTKTCCITGRCATCQGKCGALARDFNVKNATNRDAESVAYWQQEMMYGIEPEFGDMTEQGEVRKHERSQKDIEDKYYARLIDQWDGEDHGGSFRVGRPSQALIDVGIPDVDIWFDQSKAARQLKNKVEIDKPELKAIPSVLAHPIAISESYDNTVVVFGELHDKYGHPIVIALRVNSTNRRNRITVVNKIRSVGTRNTDLDKLLDEKAILYLGKNKKETNRWFNALGRSTPFGGTKFGLIRSITFDLPDVNTSGEEIRKSSRDSSYLDAVKRGDMETVKRMVAAAADKAGLSTEHLFHGTPAFGFTTIDTSKSDDSISFFATNNPEVAQGYMPWYEDDASDRHHNGPRRIGKGIKQRAITNRSSVEDVVKVLNATFDNEYKNARAATDEETLNSFKLYHIPEMVEAASELINRNVPQKIKDLCRLVVEANEKDTFAAWAEVSKRYKEFETAEIPYDPDDWSNDILWSRVVVDLQSISKMARTEPIWNNGAVIMKSALIDRYNTFLGGESIGMYDFYGNNKNQLVIWGEGSNWKSIPLGEHDAEYRKWLKETRGNDVPAGRPVRASTRDISEFAKHMGYRSVVFVDIYDAGAYGDHGVLSDVYSYFYPQEDIKSADPVTYDDDGNVIPLSKRFDATNNDIRYSTRDSAGKTLSKGQLAYFANSVVRDAAGNLMVMYHGTANGGAFTIFDGNKLGNEARTTQIGQGFYFTNAKEEAESYTANVDIYGRSSKGKNPHLHQVYLNITNPFNVSEDTLNLDDVKAVYGDGTYAYFFDNWIPFYLNKKSVNGEILTKTAVQAMSRKEKVSLYVDYLAQLGTKELLSNMVRAFPYGKQSELLASMQNRMGYDGIVEEFAPGKYQYVAFSAEQIKSTDNTNPTVNPDIRYSDRSTDSVSNRTLLADALESTAQHEVERKKLQEYKSKISAMEELEAKLNDINAQIRELSFSKGPKDKAKLSELKDEKIKTQNRINNYDKQLLRLESTAALQAVVERERKAVFEKAKAKYGKAADARVSAKLGEIRQQKATMRGYEKDLAIMEREFLRIAKEYEKKSSKAESLYDALKAEAKSHKQDAALWEKEFARLMRSYDAAGRKADQLQEQINQQRESARNKVENRRRTEMRHKIQKVVAELNDLLETDSKKRHVPDALKKSVADALSILNMDTTNTDERIAKYVSLIAKERAKAEPDQEKIDAYTTTMDNIRRQSEKMGQRLKELRDAYEDIQHSSDPDIANAYDPVIAGAIRELTQTIGNTSIRDMSIDQLTDVYAVYRMVLTRVRDANKALIEGINASISEMATHVITEVRAVGGKRKSRVAMLDPVKKFMWNNMKPVYAMEYIGSKALTHVFENVRDGEDVWAKDITEARQFYLEKNKKYGYDKWDFDKKYRFESVSGDSFELTLEQMLSLYAYSKRDQAHDHLRLGGFVFDSNIETTKDKGGKLIKYKVNTADAHQIDLEILSAIIGNLTNEQMRFVDDMQEYLSTVMGAKGNEVTSKMYGVKLFKEKYYFPLKSAKQFMFEQNEVAGEVKIKNSGFTNKVVAKANNPVILSNFMDVWAGHVNDMSMYHAFTLPLEDFNRVFNYNSPKTDEYPSVSVKGTVQNAYGPHAVNYVKQLITDLNGGARSDPATDPINKLMGLFKKGAVFASASVVVQQPSAIARALALVDAKYFVGAKIDKKRHKALWAELKQYAPVAIIKEMGYFDTNMGMSTQDFIKSKEYDTLGEKVRAVVTDADYRDELLSIAPAYADEVAWCGIWNAVKRETKAKYPGLDVKGEPFLKLAGSRFTEVITKTQVYDSILSRSGNMRSKDTGMKMATAFMAEPTTSINMVFDALLQGKRGNRKYARTAIGAVIASQILNAALVGFVYAARDDDEDETYLEKYLESFLGNSIDSMNPLTYIPFIKDIISIVQGYDVERSDMAVISDLWQAIQSLGNENVSGWKKVEGFVGSVCQIFGLPVKNIMRDARGFYQALNSMAWITKQKPTKAGFGYAAKAALPKWMGGGAVSNEEQLYRATLNGDTEHLARVKGRYTTEKKVQTAMRSAIKDHYLKGDIDASTAQKYLTMYTDDDESEAYWKVEEWRHNAQFEEEFGKYNEFYDAVLTGKNLKATIQKYIENGVSEDTLRSQISDHFKEKYIKMSTAEKANIKGYLLNAMTVLGNTRSEAEQKIKNWEFEQASGFSYENRREEYLEGNITEDQLREAVNEYGGLSNSETEDYIEDVKFEEEYGFKYDERDELYKDGALSKETLREILMSHGGLSDEEADEEIADIEFEMEYGFRYSNRNQAYKRGDITREELYEHLTTYGGKTPDEANKAIAAVDFEIKYGYTYANRVDAYKDGAITEAEMRNALAENSDMDDTEIDNTIRAYNWMRDNSQYDLTVTDVLAYTKPIEKLGTSIEDSGIDPNTFVQYRELRTECKGVDSDGDGTADRNSVKNEVLSVINSLPISSSQKDALYYQNGWAASKIGQAPWH